MLKKISLIAIMLNVWGASVSAQSIYADIASEMAKEGINQAEAKLNQLPEMLRDGIDIATSEREFESDEYCLGNVQALVNMGAVASNIMPFTKVWTYEDDRGPVGKLRVMLNGEKIHIEVYCDKNVLKSKTLPWGDGDKTLQEVNMSSVSALLGVGLNFQLQGIFENEDIVLDSSLNLTAEQKENIENIIINEMKLCWNPPIGSENGLPQSIILGLKFDIKGRLIESAVNLTPYSGVGSLQAFEVARRAVLRCQPYKLPADAYEYWREMEIELDPSEMVVK